MRVFLQEFFLDFSLQSDKSLTQRDFDHSFVIHKCKTLYYKNAGLCGEGEREILYPLVQFLMNCCGGNWAGPKPGACITATPTFSLVYK